MMATLETVGSDLVVTAQFGDGGRVAVSQKAHYVASLEIVAWLTL